LSRKDSQEAKPKTNKKAGTDDTKSSTASLNGAAIIDENGREIPITEAMIVEAFDEIKNLR